MKQTKEVVVDDDIHEIDHCKSPDSNMEEDVIELSSENITNDERETDKHVQIITYELKMSRNNLQEKIENWRQVRKHTVESLRELADYLDNIGRLANIVVAMRGSLVAQGFAVGSGILTFAVGVSVPFLIAGAGIGLASFICRVVRVGGGLVGTCLGVVGGVMTVATAGASLPVVVAGCGLWFASGIARWVGAGGGLVARGVTLLGGAVMVLTASTAVVVCLGGAGLWLAVPAITREILGSRQVEIVSKDIGEDARVTDEMLRDLEQASEEEAIQQDLILNVAEAKHVISGKVTVLLDSSPLVWDILQLKNGIKTFVKDWKEGPTHLRIIADQLEEGIEKVSERNLAVF